MRSDDRGIVLFTGTSHPLLGKEIADYLGVALGRLTIERFPDGEISLQVLENVRGRDVFVLQTIAIDPNNYLMELLILVDALKRASAQSINVVIPYFGYARQDRRNHLRVPITAKLVANLLEQAGTQRVISMDLHAEQIEGFFDISVDHLQGRSLILEALKQEIDCRNMVVVAPDEGSIKLTKAYARQLRLDFAIVDKHRSSAIEVEAVTLIGDIAGKDVLLADDMCSTAGTLVSAAKVCQEKGAKRIFGAVTHGLFVKEALQKLQESPIEVLYVSNTIPPTEFHGSAFKLRYVSLAPLFGQAIDCILSRESISSLLMPK